MAYLLRSTTLQPEPLTPANGTDFALEELQALVGGFIEVLRLPGLALGSTSWMVLNEDGKRLNLAVNLVATALVRTIIRPDDDIVGDVVLCSWAEMGEDDEEPPL